MGNERRKEGTAYRNVRFRWKFTISSALLPLLLISLLLVSPSPVKADLPSGDLVRSQAIKLKNSKICDPATFLHILSVKSRHGYIDATMAKDARDVACALDIAANILAKRNHQRFGITGSLAKALVVGIAHQESAFTRHAVSSKDAVGIMQVHWPTWRGTLESVGLTRKDLYDPFINSLVGVFIFEDCLLKRNGDIIGALGCYYGKTDRSYVMGVLQRSKQFVTTALLVTSEMKKNTDRDTNKGENKQVKRATEK